MPRGYIEIADWLPDSNEELIVSNFEDDQYLVEFLSVTTGQRQRVVETSQNIVGKPVWLPAKQQMTYLAQAKTGAINLYLSTPDKQDTDILTLSDVSPPLAPALDDKGVLVFDRQMRQLLNTGQEVGKIQALSMTEPLPRVEGGPFARYQAAWSEKTDWIAYYNPEKFVLI